MSIRFCGNSTLVRSGSPAGAPIRKSPRGKTRMTGASGLSWNKVPAGVARLMKLPSTIASPDGRRPTTSRKGLSTAVTGPAPSRGDVLRSATQVSSLRQWRSAPSPLQPVRSTVCVILKASGRSHRSTIAGTRRRRSWANSASVRTQSETIERGVHSTTTQVAPPICSSMILSQALSGVILLSHQTEKPSAASRSATSTA
jgi:hypothetical protein